MKSVKKTKRNESATTKYIIYSAVGVVVLAVIALLIAVVFVANREERAIKKVIKRGVQAVMDEDVDTCLGLLHESYTDSLDNDYDTVRDRAAEAFQKMSEIAMKTRRMKVEVDRGVGTATFEMRFTAKVSDSVVGEVTVSGVTGAGSPLGLNWERVSMRCVKRRGTWLVSQIVIEPLESGLL